MSKGGADPSEAFRCRKPAGYAALVSADDDKFEPAGWQPVQPWCGPPAADRCTADIQEWLNLLAEYWVIPVLGELGAGPQAYNHLLDLIDEGISEPELASTIAQLESRGLVAPIRAALATGSAEPTDYCLTPAGLALLGPLTAMRDWYHAHAHEIRHIPQPPPGHWRTTDPDHPG